MKKTDFAVLAAFLTFAAFAADEAVDRPKVEAAPAPIVEAASVEPVPLAAEIAADALETPSVPKADERGEWYERIVPKPDSRAWWIVFAAREKAKRGEDTGYLRRILADTLAKWFSAPSAPSSGGDGGN